MKRIKKCFGGAIVLKSLRDNQITESPINGEKIVGGIIMNNNNKIKKIVDSSIPAVFINDKLLGSPLYYLIGIYEIIKDDEEYKEIVPSLKQIIVERMKTSHSFASFTGRTEFVQTLLRTDVSMWYVLHSCLIDLPPCNDPFILHCDDLDVFVEMLELIGYKIDESLKRQVKRMKVFITLRNKSHKQRY